MTLRSKREQIGTKEQKTETHRDKNKKEYAKAATL